MSVVTVSVPAFDFSSAVICAQTVGRASSTFFEGTADRTTAPLQSREVFIAAPQHETHVAEWDRLLDGTVSHDDVISSLARRSERFSEALESEREKRYREHLAEVSRGHLSRLAAERMRLRLSQSELADSAGMRQPNISRLEKNPASMSVKSAKRLSAVFGIDYRELL